jgi:uncharacterized glyoxalase superfamily protein PhnB
VKGESIMNKTKVITRRRFVTTTVSAAALTALAGQASVAEAPPKQVEGMRLTPYLLFNGNCRDAMEFYRSCLGGELELTKVKNSGAKGEMTVYQQEKVLNAHLKGGAMEIQASVWLRPDESRVLGNTVCMFLYGGSLEMQKRVFE